MIHNYLEFINEVSNDSSASNRDHVIYYADEVEETLKEDWSDISVKKHKAFFYLIHFRIGDGKYDWRNVLVEKKGNEDFYYLEDPELFKEKFKAEFWDRAGEYVNNLVYAPKCLGDITPAKRGKGSGLLDINTI